MKELEKLLGYGLLGLLAFGLYAAWKDNGGSLESLTSKADCRVLAVQAVPDSYLIRENLDFGYTIQTRVRNVGEHGQMSIKATLSTSEGNFERTQTLTFNTNQEATLSYQFPEPTINASGIQPRVTCSPSKANKK